MEINFEEYKKTIKKAIDKNDEIKKNMDAIISRKIDNIFFIGCGGSLAIMFPVQYIMDLHSKIPTFIMNAGEFNNLKPKKLGENSLVILISSSGSTPEILQSAKLAKEEGAFTIGLSASDEPKLSKEVDYSYHEAIKTYGINEFKLIVLYQIIFYLIKKNDNYSQYTEIIKSLELLPDNLVRINQQVENIAVKFAKKYKNEKIFYTIGSGICWGQAYSFAICKLEEMQWLTTQPIHAGEYFHGPFEVVDEKSNLLIFKGEDVTRPLINRVVDFSKKYTKKIEIFDTKDFNLQNVPQDLRGYFSPFILLVTINNLAEYLAIERNHPLSTRRYMGKVEY